MHPVVISTGFTANGKKDCRGSECAPGVYQRLRKGCVQLSCVGRAARTQSVSIGLVVSLKWDCLGR